MVMPADSASASHALPLLSVLRGEPTPAELAAVTVVLGAMSRRAGQGPATTPQPASRWSARDRMLRPQLVVGPGAWRASALPR